MAHWTDRKPEDFAKLRRTTVAELLEQLKDFPGIAPVFTSGHEGGYEDAGAFYAVKIKLNVNKENYYGPHENCRVENADGEIVDGYAL